MQTILLVLVLSLFTNNPPAVTLKINTPASNLETGAQITYEIKVSDPEDGESIYEEIPGNEVFLHVVYSQVREEPPCDELEGLTLVKQFDCFTCHKVKQRFVGPSFNDIAEKYRDTNTDLTLSLLRGSTGKWSNDAVMPVNSEITRNQAKKMISWILATEKRKNQQYFMGTSGMIRVDPSKKDWNLILMAMYRDHGGLESDPLTGCDNLMIRVE